MGGVGWSTPKPAFQLSKPLKTHELELISNPVEGCSKQCERLYNVITTYYWYRCYFGVMLLWGRVLYGVPHTPHPPILHTAVESLYV